MMEMAPTPMMEIKLIQKINLSNDGNRQTPPLKMEFFHHFLFEGTPYLKTYSSFRWSPPTKPNIKSWGQETKFV